MDSGTQYDQMEEGKKPVRRFYFKKKKKDIDPATDPNDPALDDAFFDPNEEEDVYIVKQRHGYFSYLFSLAQTIILTVMMWKCGIAPLNINPMIGPYPDALNEWGGKNAYDIIDEGQWWRLITPIMLHAGIIHLLCNIAVQIETGAFFEREWGSFNWLVVYLTSAVGSSILSTIVMPNAVSVGSSGAVMGLFGAKLAEVICRACERTKTAQQRLGHQVRKEQCFGVFCSVFVVMLFSFIPYGK
jgi:membrane associated rhomboid family serine protease